MEKIPRYELTIEDIDNGVTCISLVDFPAIQTNWVALSESQKTAIKISLQDKQILTAPLMIPNLEIYREDENKNGYNIFFSESTIEDMRDKYFSDELIKKINFMHTDKSVHGELVESWIISDANNDKAKALGFDLPKGSWMISLKIKDSDFWEKQIKTGNVKGFSLEGVFKNKQIFNNVKIMEKESNVISEFFSKFFLSQEERDKIRDKKQDEYNAKMLQISEQTQLAIIHNSTMQMLSGESIVTNQALNIGSGLSITCNKFGQAKQLDNNNFTFSEVKNGKYTTIDHQEFEIRDGIAFVKLETVEVEAEVSLAFIKEIIIPGGESINIADDGYAYKADNTLYPDGEYTDETGKIIVIEKGEIKEVQMATDLTAQLSAMQKQIQDLTVALSKVNQVLKKESPAKDVKTILSEANPDSPKDRKVSLAERVMKQSKSRY